MVKLFCDSSTTEGCYVLEGEDPIVIPYKEKVTNNVGEYKIIILALDYAKEQGIKNIAIWTDSEFVVNQVRGWDKYGQIWKKCKPHLLPYREKVRELLEELEVELDWLPREKNLAGKVLG